MYSKNKIINLCAVDVLVERVQSSSQKNWGTFEGRIICKGYIKNKDVIWR